MRLRLSVFLFFCAGIFLVGCGPRETRVTAGNRDGILHLGNGAEPQDLDPQLISASTDQNLAVALFEGLTTLDEKTSQPIPGVAERWEVSPDGLTWTFHLRATARWSDGSPLTADDFVQSWRRILAPALGAENAYLLYPIQSAAALNDGSLKDPAALGVAAPDARTLVVTLERPTPYFPTLTALTALFPINPRVLATFSALKQRGTAWTLPPNLVGNGPFLLREWTPNARLIVEKNPHYWNAAHVALRQIVFYPIENPGVEERVFRAGQLHATYELPLSKVETYRRESPSQLRIEPYLETFFLRFNVAKPPLDRREVRAALARALDRESITRNLLSGTRVPAHHFTPPDCAGYTARATIPDDFAEGRRLLAAAGFPGGRGFPKLELQIRNDELHAKVAEAIQAMWKRELGIDIALVQLEQKTWLQNQQSKNYTITTSRWVGDFVDPVTYLEVHQTGGGYNFNGWSDARYDELLRRAALAPNAASRYEFFQQAEAILLDAAPSVPLFFGARIYLQQPSVQQWSPALLGLHRYGEVKLAR
jgi:oligopeptide transport system substrate-binding protein